MSTFSCAFCKQSCCQCQGCYQRQASNGAQVCTKCIIAYEEHIRNLSRQQAVVIPQYISPINIPKSG